MMGQQGIIDFFAKSEVPLADILPVIFSCEGQASAMGRYTEPEFLRAMTCLGLEDEKDFCSKKNEIRSRFTSDKKLFNKLWKYCFSYMASGAKFVGKELCSMMIPVLCKDKYPIYQKIVDFLNSDQVCSI